MKRMMCLLLVLLPLMLSASGCAVIERVLCAPNCQRDQRTASSLVEFLYPNGAEPPANDTVPELRLPLRVGLAFLPMEPGSASQGQESARREELLARIKQRFADRDFIAQIDIVPEYYLANQRGFAGLEGVQRLYNLDLLALVSYDQQTHLDDNEWSLSYLTIVGAYVVKGSRHDVSTLVDLAIIDPATKSLVLRAGGTDTRHGNATLLAERREAREASAAAFAAATGRMIENFDVALERFRSDVREGKARVRVVRTSSMSGGRGGGGAFDVGSLLVLSVLAVLSFYRSARRVR